MTRAELEALAVETALEFGIEPALVCAVITNESSWKTDATRFEPAFFNRYISHMTGLSDEEKKNRATSFGLMQIMGQVAREQGFDGPLTDLFDPPKNLKQGCKKLQKCISRELHEHGTFEKDRIAALLRYNGGADAGYPERVMAHYATYKHLNPNLTA